MTNKFFVCSECAIPVDSIASVIFPKKDPEQWAVIVFKVKDADGNSGVILYDKQNAKSLCSLLQNL